MNINILYEDNHLLVVEKPVNIPVQQDSSHDEDLLTILKEDIKVRYNKLGNVYLGLVHRLDRPVGGAIVFAKTSKAASRLANHLRQKNIKRTYLTVVRGTPKQKRATLVHYLEKDRKRNFVHASKKATKHAKKAILNYEVIQSHNGLSLLSVELQTGRSHQIRVQLATEGTPIFGDQKYGKGVNKPGQQIALWARELSLPHTTKDEIITCHSLPPVTVDPWLLFSEQLR
ncbi:MAG TPA: RNA pseudouridine synthase [Bacillota bacterium]|nr:RNA pseudouridine synthase [Bacillota bacterium]